MEFEYQADLAQVPNCPPKSVLPPNGNPVFRFVRLPLEGHKNYHPPAKLSPSRMFPESQQCAAFALSVFDSAEKAEAFFKQRQRTNKNFHKAIGTHLAKATLEPTDGVVTVPSKSGHSDLFQARGAELHKRFSLVGPLPITPS